MTESAMNDDNKEFGRHRKEGYLPPLGVLAQRRAGVPPAQAGATSDLLSSTFLSIP